MMSKHCDDGVRGGGGGGGGGGAKAHLIYNCSDVWQKGRLQVG